MKAHHLTGRVSELIGIHELLTHIIWPMNGTHKTIDPSLSVKYQGIELDLACTLFPQISAMAAHINKMGIVICLNRSNLTSPSDSE